MENHLLPEEQIISKSESNEVLLTNYRLRYSVDNAEVTSIMLDQISGVRILKQSQPWLLLLAGLCLIAAIVFATGPDNSYPLIALVATAIFVILYFATRAHVITVASSSMSIVFQTKGIGSEKVLAFVNQIEDARREFLKMKHVA
jgi:hypothetical protein